MPAGFIPDEPSEQAPRDAHCGSRDGVNFPDRSEQNRENGNDRERRRSEPADTRRAIEVTLETPKSKRTRSAPRYDAAIVPVVGRVNANFQRLNHQVYSRQSRHDHSENSQSQGHPDADDAAALERLQTVAIRPQAPGMDLLPRAGTAWNTKAEPAAVASPRRPAPALERARSNCKLGSDPRSLFHNSRNT